jgi:regulator of protease activity HflC (stomatin/prohibitin superfamily)
MVSAPILVFAVFAIVLLFACIRIIAEYERGVVFRLGRFNRVMEAGLNLMIPGVARRSSPGTTCRSR